MKQTTILRASSASLALAFSLTAGGAFAQVADGSLPAEDAAVSADGSEVTNSIIVTGSRIARPDLESASPVTVVGAEQIALTGTQTIETLLNDLPQVIPGNTRVSNNAGGENFSTLDLRGLGPQRTLILLNGERLPPSSATGVVDISQIPVGLIQRVDVVTGGTSAVYGSDAIGGVVNFILREDFEGVEFTGQTGISESGAGFNYNVSGTIGANFADGRGNMTVYGSFFEREAVGQGRFDYSRKAGAIVYDPDGNVVFLDDARDFIPGSTIIAAGGSATSPWGSITTNTASNPFNTAFLNTLPGFAAGNTPANCTRSTGTLTFNPSGQLSPTFGGGACTVGDGAGREYGSSRYNYAPDNYLITPYDRLNLSVIGRYEFSDDTTLRMYASYGNANQQVNLAPTPATGIVVPANSPLIPADLAAALASRPDPTAPFTMSRRFTETGPRDGRYRTDTFSARLILDHQLNDNWNVNVIGSFGRIDNALRGIGNINRTAVTQGLNGCPVGSLPGCVPIDIFGQDTLTPAMLNFVRLDTQEQEEFEQVRVAANLTGELFELPGGPIGIAVGAEYRKDTGSVVVDDAQRTGNIYGFNAVQSLAGSINVKEVYGEVRVPVLDILALGAGARYSSYNITGELFNWKAEVEFTPIDAIKFRGTYNKAARAPSVFELFQNGDQGFFSTIDLCNATDTRTDQVRAACIANGVPVDLIDTFQQINSQAEGFSFGDASLEEEKAETWTAGAVISPGRIFGGNLNLTVDYYDITLTNRIAGQSPQTLLNQCYNLSNAFACSQIRRDPATGQLAGVNVGRLNQPTPLYTSGIDAGLDWTIPVNDDMRFYLSNLLTYVISYQIGDDPTSGPDQTGTQFSDTAEGGIGGVTYKWGNTVTAGVRTDSFTGQVRYVWRKGGKQDYPGGTFEGLFPDGKGRIPDLHLVNLSANWKANENFDFTFIVNNLLDKYPPQTAGGYFEQANTNINFYDGYALGRNYTVQARVRF